MSKEISISVIGLGYVGLPLSALLADSGFKVKGVDINKEIVDLTNTGKSHIAEPGLEKLLKKVVSKKNLVAYEKPSESDVFIIAVPTPIKEGFEPDVDKVMNALDSIIPLLNEGNLVIIQSTVPVGFSDMAKSYVLNKRNDLENKILWAYCPERVFPGEAIAELKNNNRIIGVYDDRSAEIAKSIYSSFVNGNIFITDVRTAEMCKLVENAYRDVNIAFANEISILCNKYGVDVEELIRLVNNHPRVDMLKPGVGVGGHCIAIDPYFLIWGNDEAKLIKTAREVNLYKTKWVISQIELMITQFSYKEKYIPTVGLLGLSYKPDVDDLRESPSLEIAREIIRRGYRVMVSDVYQKDYVGDIKICPLEDVLSKCNLIFILTLHKEYRELVGRDNIKLFSFY